MLNHIKQWLEPPQFEGDEEQTNQARIANTLILYLGAALLIVIFILIPLFAFQKIGSWIISITTLCGLAIGRHLIFKGRFQLGGTLIFAIIYLCILAMLILSGGSSGTAMFYFATVVLIAGFFLDERVVNVFTLATFLIAMGISFLQERGLVTIPKVFVFNSVFSWIATGIGLLFMIRTRDLFVGNLKNALKLARQENAARQKVEAILRENEEKFKAQYKGIPVPTYTWQAMGDDLILADYNDNAFKFTQGRIVNLLGKTASVIYRDDPETFNQLIECIRTKVNSRHERWHRLASTGERRYLAIHYAFVPPNLVMVHTEDDTERMRAEVALRESEAKFRAVVENSNDGILFGDANAVIHYRSPSYSRINGYTDEERVGHSGFETVHPNDADDLHRWWAKLIEHPETTHKTEYRILHKDGKWRWIETSGQNLLSNPDIHSIVVTSRDITEHKQAEEALQESEARLRAVVQTANDAIITMDMQGSIVDWNAAAEMIFGYSADEALGKPVNQIVPKQFREQMHHRVERTHTSNERHIIGKMIEVSGLAKDGREFPIEMSLAEWKTQAGNFFTAIIRDISERKQAEEQISQSEKKYRELFEVNKDGIAIFLLNPHGPPGTFVEVNEAAPQMLGYTREEMLQLTPTALEPNVTQEQLQIRQAGFDSKGAASFETILQHKNGHPVFAEFSAQMIQYEGKPAIMNIVRDITKRKQRENELRAIATLSAALRTAPTRAEMLPVIIEEINILLNSDAATVEIIDQQTGNVTTEVANGLWTNLAGARQAKGTGINAIISQTLEPYITHDLENDPNIFYHEWARAGIRGSAGVPLIAQDELIGFIWVGRKTDISELEVRLLASVTDIAANAIYRATLHEQTQKDAADLALAYDTTLEGWARALELRDHETEGHTRRVVQTTLDLARIMGIRESEMENVRRGALLHDIGKMGIPDSILLKPGALDDDEWKTMRQHPEYAYKLLEPIEYLRPVLDIPYCHHERWDGTGYPRKLKGEQIPLEARIFAVVDVWDALTSDRPYRLAWSKEKSLAYIAEQRGGYFDPEIVEAFLKII